MTTRKAPKRVTQCTATHPGKRPHPVRPGYRVCPGCLDATRDALTALPRLWAELLRVHLGQGDGLHVTASVDWVPYRDAVGDERALAAAQTRAWAKWVAHQRGVTPPAPAMPAHTTLLIRHLDWLARSDQAGPFSDAMQTRHSTALRLLYPVVRRRFIITRANGQPARCLDCSEPLAAVIRDADDLLPSEIHCSGCGQAIPARQWVTYARQLHRSMAGTT